MLPLSLLRTAQNHPMLVELKNGETCNGHLVSCNYCERSVLIKTSVAEQCTFGPQVICTSRDGD